jgi:hypothetical protein
VYHVSQAATGYTANDIIIGIESGERVCVCGGGGVGVFGRAQQ